MQTKTGPTRGKAGPGFTLIEVLLVTVLLLLLLGAIVFSFSSLERGARLDEGAEQFDALLRFARAQAASSGRQVQLDFEAAPEPELMGEVAEVRMTWEPDPLGKPGQFEELPEGVSYLAHINELVRVDSLRLTGPGSAQTWDNSNGGATGDEFEEDLPEALPPIRFHPDGSSDSAEIRLSSRDEQDKRVVMVRLLGLTGAIKRVVMDESDQTTNASEPVLTSPATPAVPAAQPAVVATTPAGPSSQSRGGIPGANAGPAQPQGSAKQQNRENGLDHKK